MDTTIAGHFTNDVDATGAAPTRLAAGPGGAVYFTDSMSGRVVLNRGGSQRVVLTGFDRPLGIALSGALLFVGSQGRGSVEVFDLDRRQAVGVLGRGRGEFQMPNAIAVAPDDAIYVADSRANVVKAYRKDGSFQGAIGAGTLSFPAAVAADGQRVVVADQGHRRLVAFDRHGKLLAHVGALAPASAASIADLKGAFMRVQGVALRGGEVLALDAFFGTVQRFDDSGAWKATLGVAGNCEGCARVGLDLAVASDGKLLVADPQNHRIVVAAEAMP
jgi:DNA-binding beta-propeller fold protein YncE